MLMIWSEVAPIREVTERSKDAFFLLFCFVFVGNLFWGDKSCFIFYQRQFLLHHYQKTFITIRYYFVLLHLGVQVYNGAYRRPTSDNEGGRKKNTDTRYNCAVFHQCSLKHRITSLKEETTVMEDQLEELSDG